MNIEKAIDSLKARGFGVSRFASGSEAVEYMAAQIQGKSVGIGGCQTAQQLGLYEKLCENNSVYWHWKDPAPETRPKANAAEVYICSANAISEDGEILNIDGSGNRLAALAYGNKKVYIVAGTNKLCPDFDSALHRARNVAAVKNCGRFNVGTPCKEDGKCHDCLCDDRICRALLVLWGPMMGMETEVVLIDEELGY